MTFLFLMLANGWMTRFTKIDWKEGMDIYVPLFFMVAMVHLIFGILKYVDQDAYHKYHDFHGIIGYGLICIKLILVGIHFLFYT